MATCSRCNCRIVQFHTRLRHTNKTSSICSTTHLLATKRAPRTQPPPPWHRKVRVRPGHGAHNHGRRIHRIDANEWISQQCRTCIKCTKNVYGGAAVRSTARVAITRCSARNILRNTPHIYAKRRRGIQPWFVRNRCHSMIQFRNHRHNSMHHIQHK